MTSRAQTHPTDTRIRVHYPVAHGRIVLRSDSDWASDIEAGAVTHNGQCAEFLLPLEGPFSYFKPVLQSDHTSHWAQGKNYLALGHDKAPRDIYPHFFDDGGCTVCDIQTLDERAASLPYRYRVFTPPGYHENTLKRYPTLYLQDGQNVFFPSESYSGADWRIAQTLGVLNDMNAIDKVIAVAIYPRDRENDYTLPGYQGYGRFVTGVLKPTVDAAFRTLGAARDTAVMGASLGGVVSLYLAWQWPEVFGMAASLSSTFGWRDDLLARIASEVPRDVRLYLDSGWPQDNFEVTRDMVALLLSRGYSLHHDLLYMAFPGAAHDEKSWALRTHIPFQFLLGNRDLSSAHRHAD